MKLTGGRVLNVKGTTFFRENNWIHCLPSDISAVYINEWNSSIYIYIYIYRERERENEGEQREERDLSKPSSCQFHLEFNWFELSLTSGHTKVKEPNLPYNLSIAGRRIIGFISSLALFTLCEVHFHLTFELRFPCPLPTTVTSTLWNTSDICTYI